MAASSRRRKAVRKAIAFEWRSERGAASGIAAMNHESYRLDREYRASIDNRLRKAAEQLLSGAIGVIAASRAMSPFEEEVAAVRPAMDKILMTFVAIQLSETDALPIGAIGEMWHPSTSALEDQKIADAEERFRSAAHEACLGVLTLLDSDVITLWRPVGPRELDLISASGMREFPPRLPEQPIFNPVLTEAYATKIARDWNAPRGGFVTRFQIRRDFIQRYPAQDAGGREQLEYWIPAEDLSAFNNAIVGQIEVIAEFPATSRSAVGGGTA